MPPPLSFPQWAPQRNVAVLSRAEYVPTLTAAAALRVKAALSKAAWWPWPWPFDSESGVRVTCDVGYLCANFGLPRSLCSRLRPDVRVRRQTERRQTKASLNAPPIRGGDNDPVNVRENDWRFVDKLCSTNMSVSVNYVITMSEFNE